MILAWKLGSSRAEASLPKGIGLGLCGRRAGGQVGRPQTTQLLITRLRSTTNLFSSLNWLLYSFFLSFLSFDEWICFLLPCWEEISFTNFVSVLENKSFGQLYETTRQRGSFYTIETSFSSVFIFAFIDESKNCFSKVFALIVFANAMVAASTQVQTTPIYQRCQYINASVTSSLHR